MKKKLLSVALVVAMVASLMTACGSGSKSADYKLGMGIVVEDSSSTGKAQIDATVAAVITDADGKIVSCYLDVAQTKMTTEEGTIQDASEVDLRSKQEKGDDYNMVAYGGAISEWYEQADFFAEKVVGMTADEVANLATTVNEEGHTVATDEAIFSGCTMSIAAFQEAIVKACNDEFAKSFKASSPKLGLGVVTEVDSSCASATADADGAANMYTHFAAVAVDEDGKILADLIDAIQPKIAFNTAGEETEYKFVDTKKYLKYDYNMVAYGNSVGEWFEETKVFEDYIVGKDAAGVTGIATVVNEEGHSVATDADADLLAGCTISISTFQEAVAKACNNAR
ncbi:MAG: hypothetical protein ACI4F0_01495 [Agathobacter sp.]